MLAVSVHVPAPLLVRLVAPVLSAITKGKTPLAEPVKVRVRVPVWLLKEMVPVLEKVKVPDPEESIPPPEDPMLTNLSVETAPPVYLRVPPLIMRLVAALVEAPIPLEAPPSAKVETLKVPAVMVLTPV